MTRSLWIALALLAAAGCAVSPQQRPVDAESERRALLEADQAWFDSHQNLEAFLTFLADDAHFMAAGAPLARGESIRTTWEQLLAMPGFALEWQATSAEVSAAGDLGYTVGTYELTMEQDGTPLVTVGKYVTVWKKQADGSWKVAVDCFNADGPPTEA